MILRVTSHNQPETDGKEPDYEYEYVSAENDDERRECLVETIQSPLEVAVAGQQVADIADLKTGKIEKCSFFKCLSVLFVLYQY